MLRRERRETLGKATLASLALHVAVLGSWPDVRRFTSPSSPVPLLARLAPAVEPTPTARVAPLAPQSKPRSVRRVAVPATSPVASAEPERATRDPAPATDAQSPTDPGTLKGLSGASLEQYRLMVMSRARRIHVAQPVGLPELVAGRAEARTQVRLTMGADGGAASVNVSASSGERALDREAARRIAEAARQVPLPAALRGVAFDVDVWVIFAPGEADR